HRCGRILGNRCVPETTHRVGWPRREKHDRSACRVRLRVPASRQSNNLPHLLQRLPRALLASHLPAESSEFGHGGCAIKKMLRSHLKGADGEAVKKLESSAIPLLASLQGGVAERFRKYREA